MIEQSVVICTHNPKPHYLRRVLDALHRQTVPITTWELLVVDNNSTSRAAGPDDIRWHPRARIVTESSTGLTSARLRGISEVTGKLLIFVDDDNVLDPDYLERAGIIANNNPTLGAWSGQCRPEFEKAPPAWTRRYWGNLCIREFKNDAWSNLPYLAETMPCGAGLCARRSVAQHYLELHVTGQRAFRLDRAGNSLGSAGDNDLAACATDIGMGEGIFSTLRLTHLIPPERLTLEYHIKLAEGIHFSGVLFQAFRDPAAVAQGPNWKRRIGNLLRLAVMCSRDRRVLRAALRGADRARLLLRENQKVD